MMKPLAFLPLVVLLVACSPAVTSSPVATLPADAQPVVDRAIADLAQRLGAAPDAIEVVGLEAVDWPDASLGCPQLGVLYVPVVTPGLRLTLRSAGQTYDYHTDLATRVVLCPEGGPPAATPLPASTDNPYSY